MPVIINGTTGLSGVSTVNLANGSVTQNILANGVAGTGPALLSYADGTQTASINTYTKLSCTSESFDTANAFSSNTFTPQVAGYYSVSCAVNTNQTSSSSYLFVEIRKNNVRAFAGTLTIGTTSEAVSVASGILYLNGSTDYVDVYLIQSAGTVTIRASSFISAALVRAA